MNKNIGIRVISDICRVQPHTIRMWEKRYGAFEPVRGMNGERLYGDEDVARAKAMANLIAHGQTISKVANLTLQELNEQVSGISDEMAYETNHIINEGVERLLSALKRYEIDRVHSEAEYLRLNSSSKEFIFKVVLPVMQQTGQMVVDGMYTVTQEHIVSTIIREQLGQIRLPNLPESERFALATPEGNLHELSIIIADILCKANRNSTYYLGAANPAHCLAEAVNALSCDNIILGVVSSDHWNYETHIIPYLNRVDKVLNRPVRIILGGAKPLDFPEFKNIKSVEIIADFQLFDKRLSGLS
ncbi:MULTISPECIES: MerR family transcriptional regulator [Halobacteriovorax]|uniref:MerR family transcriptional regulator n=1 Tax=Halobacteriovorax vibrionivorans TaxID=2152716 RepID=A0ABY0II78_9BACT|nr:MULTISPECIES: MerR family transcriptional regulator [Halobacteriovorax]AYF45167.1 MerR HTH family regulatory protein [Halobacteriovorax sp. BALOs_7]RZF22260.1 MerR family transcriptional regulator [Halobacteriovorax vibrionivorans]TGD48512.1 MerR family transcriptional regulator [Halobacteriovorax sp. Y22]